VDASPAISTPEASGITPCRSGGHRRTTTAIIAGGYKVNSQRAIQFRTWATPVVEESTIKGFAMDEPKRRKKKERK